MKEMEEEVREMQTMPLGAERVKPRQVSFLYMYVGMCVCVIFICLYSYIC